MMPSLSHPVIVIAYSDNFFYSLQVVVHHVGHQKLHARGIANLETPLRMLEGFGGGPSRRMRRLVIEVTSRTRREGNSRPCDGRGVCRSSS